MEDTKVCTVCNEEKNTQEFHANKGSTSGRRSACRVCTNQKLTKSLEAEGRLGKWAAAELRRQGLKRCPKCMDIKPFADFSSVKIRLDGCKDRCRACDRIQRNSLTPEEDLRVKERNKCNRLRRRFGVSLVEYRRMSKEQKDLCAICENPEKTKNRSLAVDHCHRTGKIRGLLCTSCNPAIGALGDSPELLRKAAAYIEKHAE